MTYAGNERYLGGFWIMDAPDLNVALRLAAEGSKACNQKVGGVSRQSWWCVPATMWRAGFQVRVLAQLTGLQDG